MKTIEVPNPAIDGLVQGIDYDVIDENVTYKLAQVKSPYCILKYIQKVVVLKSTGKINKPLLPTPVIERSVADVSFLAGLVVEKYSFHLPLYRQHQRLVQSGVHLSRSTLTKLIHRVGEILEPIQKALLSSILQSSILTIDETPVKAGRNKGKMKQSYFWPMYGDKDEVAFLFSSSRSRSLLDLALTSYKGIILCDGYAAYKSFQIKVAPQRVQLAQCWVHCRRKFIEAEKQHPAHTTPVLDLIGKLYHIESQSADASPDVRLQARQTHSAGSVDQIFEHVSRVLRQQPLVPSDLFVKAAKYLLKRKEELSLFLTNHDLPLDTNHIERQIRPVAVGRKNWLFCFTEVGAHISGILYSLITSCTLADVDPYDYLVDVLQRVDTHPIRDVHLLTPRLWKIHFEKQKLTSQVI
jgi:transposase